MSSRAFSANRGQSAGRVHDDRLELLAEQAALLVLIRDEHQHRVLERCLADGHGAGQRMQHADLDGVLRSRCVRAKAEGQAEGNAAGEASEGRSMGSPRRMGRHRDSP